MATSGDTGALLGIDVGTSAVKAVLVGLDGRALAHHTSDPIALHVSEPGRAEQDAADWWRATVQAIRAVCGAAGDPRVVAIGLTGQKHAFLPLDAARRPLRRAILWADGRAVREALSVQAHLGAASAVPGFFAPKWAWFRSAEPALAAQTRHLLFAKDYVRLRLTGCWATDRSEASATGLFDFNRDTWSTALADPIDIPIDFLPGVVACTEEAGRVHAAAAEETGLPESCPVAGGAGDNEAGALACGVVGPGAIAITLGTSGTVLGWSPRLGERPGLIWNRSVRPDGFAVTGTLLSAGRSLAWVRRLAWSPETPFEDVLAEAAASDPSRAPLVFVPALAGERSPVPDPQGSGAFVGLRETHCRGHLARAVIEGVALSLAEIVDLLDLAGVTAATLRVTSAGAESGLFRRLIAAAANRPISVVSTREGPARGAAMLAAAMSGAGDLDAIAASWVDPGPLEAPDPAESERLAPLGRMLRAARAALQEARART